MALLNLPDIHDIAQRKDNLNHVAYGEEIQI